MRPPQVQLGNFARLKKAVVIGTRVQDDGRAVRFDFIDKGVSCEVDDSMGGQVAPQIAFRGLRGQTKAAVAADTVDDRLPLALCVGQGREIERAVQEGVTDRQ